ncbi:carboxypeptidase-like regulatory domain-containing protein [Sphingobacterium sp. E70]|uniref:carboxypeptidase-like regulatory domain-containing protein n=1 Tax=Sphingobacterium sp. E70 TaxID=2853439 RepID=UPI00211BBE73|nr:carboxypeptidase-like regulatory domain-containing protein [Sphingobacterium sp. E70]ULT22234.1 carboxypeptidase-like regulatory domain-containing protein [Sphingobacterium sp. E70]
MSKIELKTVARLGKQTKLFFSLVVIAGTIHQAAAVTYSNSRISMKRTSKTLNKLQQEIKGRIVDESTGKPVSGVSIRVKGTTLATQTNAQEISTLMLKLARYLPFLRLDISRWKCQ